MLVCVNTRHHRRVIGPRNRRIDRVHPRPSAVTNEPPQRRNGQLWIFQREAREPIKGNENYHAIFRRIVRLGQGGESRQEKDRADDLFHERDSFTRTNSRLQERWTKRPSAGIFRSKGSPDAQEKKSYKCNSHSELFLKTGSAVKDGIRSCAFPARKTRCPLRRVSSFAE
jgi:hypothetical protein